MNKFILFAVITTFLTWSAQAATKPTDQVNILNIQTSTNTTADTEKIYIKPWSAIKLDAKTRGKIQAINSALDKENVEKFRVFWIRVVDNSVHHVMFQGNRSTIWVYEMLNPGAELRKCYVSVDFNGMMGGCQ